MKIIALEADSAGQDMDWSFLTEFGEYELYPALSQDKVKTVIKDADIIIPNKLRIDESVLEGSTVKMVCEMATGYNNIDIKYCEEKGIRVTNVSGYSTDSVAQHTVALLLSIYEKLSFYNDYVKSGRYSESGRFCYIDNYFNEVSGKTWGIVGLGAIGRRTAEIASCLGAKVVYFSASGGNYATGYKRVDFDTLLAESDIISIHCPLNEYTNDLFNEAAFKKMKSSAVLINVARGPVVNDKALADALINGEIMAAGLDVFGREPIPEDNPLLEIKDNDKLFMTPHIGWGTVEARTRLLQECALNIRAFLDGKKRNVIV